MDTSAQETLIREKASQNEYSVTGAHILWSRHAITEMVADDLDRRQVERALQTCEVIEDYPALQRPLPDCLVLGWLTSDQPIHAVVAVDRELDRLLIITVYLPNDKEWKNDYRTRKQ